MLTLQLFAGNDADEFSSILNQEHTPKILITTCRYNSTVSYMVQTGYIRIVACTWLLSCTGLCLFDMQIGYCSFKCHFLCRGDQPL